MDGLRSAMRRSRDDASVTLGSAGILPVVAGTLPTSAYHLTDNFREALCLWANAAWLKQKDRHQTIDTAKTQWHGWSGTAQTYRASRANVPTKNAKAIALRNSLRRKERHRHAARNNAGRIWVPRRPAQRNHSASSKSMVEQSRGSSCHSPYGSDRGTARSRIRPVSNEGAFRPAKRVQEFLRKSAAEENYCASAEI